MLSHYDQIAKNVKFDNCQQIFSKKVSKNGTSKNQIIYFILI